jgi:hypothetical protein
MKTYPLTEANRFVNPDLFNRLRGGARVKAVVDQQARVVVHGVELRFRDDRDHPEPGTPVNVWLERDYVCATDADLVLAAEGREAERRREEQERRDRSKQVRAKAEAANARIRLPFQWTVAIKDVLSGLSESSWGDGRSKATVQHILVAENIDEGRLKRKARDLLCTPPRGSNGKRWSAQSDETYWVDGDGKRFAPAVTCKQCLKVAESIMARCSAKDARVGLSVTGAPNRSVSAATQKILFESFMERGESRHSGRAETAWVVTQHCERAGVPYRVELTRLNGQSIGVRVVRTDRDTSPGSPPVVSGTWQPVSDAMKADGRFSAIGRDADGAEYRFWNGGGDWLRETSDESGYGEDLCFPVEWKPLATVEIVKEWTAAPVEEDSVDCEP